MYSLTMKEAHIYEDSCKNIKMIKIIKWMRMKEKQALILIPVKEQYTDNLKGHWGSRKINFQAYCK